MLTLAGTPRQLRVFAGVAKQLTDLRDRVWTLDVDVHSGALSWNRPDAQVYASPDYEGAEGIVFQFDVIDQGFPITFTVPWSVDINQDFLGDAERYVAICAEVLSRIYSDNTPHQLVAHGYKDLADYEDGGTPVGYNWWVISGNVDLAEACRIIERTDPRALYLPEGYVHQYEGRTFWHRAYRRATRTRTLITQHTGLDV